MIAGLKFEALIHSVVGYRWTETHVTLEGPIDFVLDRVADLFQSSRHRSMLLGGHDGGQILKEQFPLFRQAFLTSAEAEDLEDSCPI